MMRPPKISKRSVHGVVADLRPRQVVDDELEWFFNRAESDMGAISNFQACLGHRGGGDDRATPEDAAEASHRHRRIRSCLKAIADSDAGVLQVAYELRPWPIPLYDALGRLTGICVRLACAPDPWPADRPSQEVLEMVRGGILASAAAMREPSFAALRREAELRFAKAHKAYSVARSQRRGGS